MKFPRHLLLLTALLVVAGTMQSQAQQRVDTAPNHDHGIYNKIEQSYQKGKLNIDQKVLYKFYAGYNPQKLPDEYRLQPSSPVKCGTPATSDFKKNHSRLSRSTVSEIQSMMSDPTIQASETYQSPSGRFSIHYETTGSHAVPSADQDNDSIPDYVEEAAAAADSSYRHEVQTLGYTNPIPAGDSYDIELLNLEFIYGQTYTTPFGTAIQVENDFAEGFPPNDDPEGKQIGALKVTIAHEFKHAIQFDANQWSGETGNWLEMDATLMEEVVYDNVNDYYNYIQSDESIFSNPANTFYPGSYYHVTWALYFEEQFGSSFWPGVWDIISNNGNITMVEAMTQQLGGTDAFRQAYVESQLWHYASGPQNSSPDFGFEESANYPTPSVDTEEELLTKSFSIPRPSPRSTINSFSARYYEVPVTENLQGNITLEITSSGQNKEVGVIAYYTDETTGTSMSLLSGDGASSFITPELNWANVDKLGLVITNSSTSSGTDTGQTIVGVGTDQYDSVELNQNYPNPFNPQTRIRFTLDQATQVELKVYNSAGQLVTTLINRELSAGFYEPIFDASNLSSGVYFYQLKTDQQTTVKKMTLIK